MKKILVITLSLTSLITAGMTLAGSEEIWGTWVTPEQPTGDSLHVSQKRVFSSDGMVKFYHYESSQLSNHLPQVGYG